MDSDDAIFFFTMEAINENDKKLRTDPNDNG